MTQQQLFNNTPYIISYLMFYSGVAVADLIACCYLLFRRGNAFAADITPPLRLRRWAAAFFGVAFVGHVWWFLFYIYSGDIHSISCMVVSMLDCVGLLTTIPGTLFAMLQDRKRHVWPIVTATIPYAVLWGLHLVYPNAYLIEIATAYILLLYVLFTLYMVYAVKQYGRWLRDNYADLEHKEVRWSYVLVIVLLLSIIIYGFDGGNITIGYLVQFLGLALTGLLLWRVETLQQLDVMTTQGAEETPREPEGVSTSNIPSDIGQLLERHCEDGQLYLQHDLSLSQLAQAIGTNHYYLSQYFTQQGMNYNAYINGLRIRHFINLYHEAIATQRSFTAQQLANESGFRSYSTFGVAFKQRMGQTVTAWMRGEASKEN